MSRIDNFNLMHEATKEIIKESLIEQILSDDYDEDDLIVRVNMMREDFEDDRYE